MGSRRRSMPWLAVLLALAAWLPAGADNRRIGADGTVHRVDVEVPPAPAKGTQLRHRRSFPSGASDSFLVPGTDDGAIEKDPAVEIDPLSGALWLTWIRATGTGSQVMVARFDGTAWGTPRALVPVSGDFHDPQIRVAKTLVHVVWRQDSSTGPTFWRESVLNPGTDLAFGPETLPVPALVPAGIPYDPSTDMAYISAGLPGPNPGDPARLVTWGVRDEPVPVGYVVLMPLAAGSCPPVQADAHWRSGHLVTGGLSGNNLVYVWWSQSLGWSPVDSVPVDSTKPASDAWRLVDDLLSRAP